MITWMDHALVIGVAVAWPAREYLRYGAYRRRVHSGVPGARLAGYAEAMLIQWLLAAATVALWIALSRDWAGLGLTFPATARTWAGLGVAAGLAGLMLAQTVMVGRSPEAQAQARTALAPYAELLPADRRDLTGFASLSITAGVCEELLFRGLLPWHFGHWLGVGGAQASALALFALAHSYIGPRAVARALLAGLVAALLYVWTGSLVPSMLLHAGLDIVAGWMAYEVLGDGRSPAAAGV